jgi:hypothetical protein
MSLEISPAGASTFASAESLAASALPASNPKSPPPPPPPPAHDAVQISLSASIHQLQAQGESPTQISLALGVPLQTVSVDLGTYLIESTLASAPTLPPGQE